MKKVLTRGISKVAKQIAEESPNIVSTFLYYEPTVAEVIK